MVRTVNKCDLCGVGFPEAPFTIRSPDYTIENVCGNCMNLYAWGVTGDDEHALEVLLEKMEAHGSQFVKKGEDKND